MISKKIDNLIKCYYAKNEHINNTKENFEAGITRITKEGINKITDISKQAVSGIVEAQDQLLNAKGIIQNTVKRYTLNSSRPDMVLIVEIVCIILFLLIGLKIIPMLTSSNNPNFSIAGLMKATQMKVGDLSVAETNATQTELLAIDKYQEYFAFDPFSDDNSGKKIVDFVNLIWPVIDIILRYTVPPFILGYIIWFIIVYWPYVYAALKGWFKMIIAYGTDLLQGKFGCKWYIKMATGWHCEDVNFSDYFDPWKVRYIDIPMYYERMKYIRKYLWVKRAYYEVPYRKYIIRPRHIYKTKYRFTKMLYTHRAFDVLLKKLLNVNRLLVELPRDRLLDLLKDAKPILPSLYIKLRQAQSQIDGKKYPGVDKNGKMCMCPANNKIASKIQTIKGPVSSVANKINKIYSKYTTSSNTESFTNNNNKYNYIIISILISILILFVATQKTYLKILNKYIKHYYVGMILLVLFIL